MPFLSAALDRVKPSATIAVTDKARALKAAGRNVIGLGAGELTSHPGQHQAGGDRRHRGRRAPIHRGRRHSRSEDGGNRKFKREIGLDYKPNQIIVRTGGKQVLYNALMETFNPGDEGMVPRPIGPSYPDRWRRPAARVMCPCAREDTASAGSPRHSRKQSPRRPSGSSSICHRTRPAPAYSRQLKALTAVLVGHRGLGDHPRHVRASGLRRLPFTTSARSSPALRPHADDERRVQGLRHDRLAHRLCRGPADDRRDVELQSQSTSNPTVDLAVGQRRGSQRTAGFHPQTTRCSRSAATSWSRC